MADLAQILDAKMRSGEITALTVWPAGKGFQCNARFKTGGWRCVAVTQPSEGVLDALTGPGTSDPSPMPTDKPDEGGVFG